MLLNDSVCIHDRLNNVAVEQNKFREHCGKDTNLVGNVGSDETGVRIWGLGEKFRILLQRRAYRHQFRSDRNRHGCGFHFAQAIITPPI